MNIDITPREVKILISALSMPMGVSKVDRPQAEELRLRLKHQSCVATPIHQSTGGHIRSAWPNNHTLPSSQKSWNFTPMPKVRLDKTTTPKKDWTENELLEGLL